MSNSNPMKSQPNSSLFLWTANKSDRERINSSLKYTRLSERIINCENINDAEVEKEPSCFIVYARTENDLIEILHDIEDFCIRNSIPCILIVSAEFSRSSERYSTKALSVFEEPKSRRGWQDLAKSIRHIIRYQKYSAHLFQVSKDALILLNAEGKIEKLNQYAEDVLNEKQDNVYGQSVFDFFDEETRSAISQSFSKIGEQKSSLSVDGELSRGHPVEIWLDALADTEENGTNYTLMTIRDRALKKHLEEERRDTQQVIQTILETAPIGLIHLDSLGRIIGISSWFIDKFGISEINRREYIGQYFKDVEIGTILRLEESVQGLLRGQRFTAPNLRIKDRFGKVKAIIDALGIPLFGPLGDVSGALIILEDTTAVQEQTERIGQSRMLETVGALAGAMALDFNCLLGTILSHVNFLKNRVTIDSFYYADFSAIELASRSAVELSSRFQSWVRHSSDDLSPVNLNDLIRNITVVYQRAYGRQITISLELDDSVPLIMADEVQIQRALIHIYTNACEAMPHGGGISVRTGFVNSVESEAFGLKDAPDGIVRVSVQDTGIGMTPEVKEKLFQPFFSTKTDTQAAGLGLSLVSRIVDQHKGAVRVESQVGRGSTVSLYFPATLEYVNTPNLQSETEKQGDEHILLVDEETALRGLGKSLLEAGGYRVTALSNRQEAIEYYREHYQSIDLIIYDLTTPGHSGNEFIDELLKINPNAKVLLSSGCTSETEINPAVMTNTVGFLKQPYRMKSFLQTVQKAIDREETELNL